MLRERFLTTIEAWWGVVEIESTSSVGSESPIAWLLREGLSPTRRKGSLEDAC
jgi:hypothetical protein